MNYYNPLQTQTWLSTFDDLNRLMEARLIANSTSGSKSRSDTVSGAWLPLVDTKETPTDYKIYVELPGVSSEQIETLVDGNQLVVRGSKKVRSEQKTDKYTCVECYEGNFYRSFTLPETADVNRVSARLDKGVLILTLPKVEKSLAKQIKIEVKN